MSKLRSNPLLKTLAVIISVLLIIVLGVSSLAVGVLAATGAYTTPSAFRNELSLAIADRELSYLQTHLIRWYDNESADQSGIELPTWLQADQTMLRFTVTDSAGDIVLANESAPAEGAVAFTMPIEIGVSEHKVSRTFASTDNDEVTAFYQAVNSPETPIVSSEWTSETDSNGNTLHTLTLTYTKALRTEVLTISYSLAEPLAGEIITPLAFSTVDLLVTYRWITVLVAVGSLLLLILLLTYLCRSAGYRKGMSEPSPNRIDRIPFDLYLALAAGIVTLTGLLWGLVVFEFEYAGEMEMLLFIAIVTAFAALLFASLFLSLILTVATRLKCRTLLRNTIIGWLIRQIWRAIRAIGRFIAFFFIHLPLYWKAGAAILLMLAAEFVFLLLGAIEYGFMVVFMIVGNLLLIPLAIYCIVQFKQLTAATARIVDGDTDYRVDTAHMVLEFKRHGEMLGGIGEAMQKAVDEKMKSERFKTELITNVSHDIKTPLTSIINYVDLLGKEELESENAKEYIAVLERQSARLKKLIEDLVEASKASTGNLNVQLEAIDLNLLISQTTAEFEDKLTAKNLEVVTELTSASAMVRADGRLIWRVFENLMSNVCKYALEGTRLYITTEAVGDRVSVVMKNTSKYALNISGEELMERFTRGDASRHTEGSGLGLSIAGSLVELQAGSFEIVIDGDLFKAIVSLPKV